MRGSAIGRPGDRIEHGVSTAAFRYRPDRGKGQIVDNSRPPPRRVAYGKEMRIGGSGWFGRLLAVGLGAIVLVTAAMLSLIVLAVLFGVGLIVVGYLWWKTRELRRQARTFGDDGQIVDVEVVHRDVTDHDSTRR
jgi:hypothetical protein